MRNTAMNESRPSFASTQNPAIWIFWIVALLWLVGSFGLYLGLAYGGPVDRILIFSGQVTALRIILWIVPGVAALIALARLRRRAFAAALAPLAVVAAAIAIEGHGPELGTHLRFALERPGYLARIDKVRQGGTDSAVAPGSPIIAFFPWKNGLLDEDGVVYDEADAMAEPLPIRQAQWRDRRIPGYLRCGGPTTPLGGHFYFVIFYC